MAEFGVKGQDLKKMLKKAKGGPMAFGFNPGRNEDESYLAMNPRKTPEVLGKDAKEQGDGSKFAFGTALLVGKELRMTCLRELPTMAQRLKKYLKSQKVMLNVVLLDKDGKVLESDIEEGLPDDPELDGDDTEDDAAGTPDLAAEAEPEPEAAPGIDPAVLLGRLTAVRDRIAALPAEAKGRVAEAFKQLVDQVKAGELERASAGIDRLERAVAQLSAQGGATSQAPADPASSRLTQAIAGLRQRADALADATVRGRIQSALDLAAGQADQGNVEAALPILKKLQDTLAALEAQAGQRPAPGTAPAGAGDPGPAGPERQAWEGRFGAIEADLYAALSQGLVTDPGRLRADLAAATEAAAAANYLAALQILPRLEQALSAARADGGTAFGAEVPADVQPFARSRIDWGRSRDRMMEELRKLQGAIEARCREVGGLDEVIASLSDLLIPLQRIDQRLEDKLDQVVSSPAGDAREKLKSEARALIGTYRNELANSFFQEVDGANGFVPVAITSTARDALSRVEAVLAA